jgi:phosphopantothenoylcysteine decarboxylase/phosphopantothenate--cysteine ligase
LLTELVPTQKIIAQLRDWFPQARLVGWKYEVDGDKVAVIAAAQAQLAECRTDACVANGPAYGEGFGVIKRAGEPVHCPDMAVLFTALEEILNRQM